MDAKATVDRLKSACSVQTDAELARALSVPLGTLQSWKKRNAIPLEALMQASGDYGVSIDWLIYGKNNINSNSDEHHWINYELEFGCSIPATQIVLEGFKFETELIDEIMVSIDIVRTALVSTTELLLKNSRLSKVDAIGAAEPAARQVMAKIRRSETDAKD